MIRWISLFALSIGFSISAETTVTVTPVTDGLFRGARPASTDDIRLLQANGIKTVIDLQGGDYSGNSVVGYVIPYLEAGETPAEIDQERKAVEAGGMHFVSEPLDSMKPVNTVEAQSIEDALQIMNDPTEQPVYVHCAHGHDRTGLLIALYRMKFQGWSPAKAHAEMVAMGHTKADMITTWPMDMYFYEYAAALSRSRPEKVFQSQNQPSL